MPDDPHPHSPSPVSAPPPTGWRVHLRELVRPAPVRPNLPAGLRAGLATVAPVLAGPLLVAGAASWLGLAGFMVSFADRGGAYRARAASMAAVAIAAAAAVALGGLASPHPVLCVALVLLWAAAGSLAQVFGPVAQGAGTSSTIALVIALPTPATPAEALHRAGFVLLGGAWAMLLSLVLWPLSPYRPARRAVASAWRALAAYADGWVAHADRGAERPDFAPVRAALEGARDTLGLTRRGTPGESARGERLLVMLETADRALPLLVALGEEAALPAGGEAGPALSAFAGAARTLALAAESERRGPRVDPSGLAAGIAAGEEARLREGVEMLGVCVRTAAEAAAGVETGVDAGRDAARAAEPEARRPALEPLRENLSMGSVFLRHALRVGITTAGAVAATRLLEVRFGYWVTLTAFVVLQPYAGATMQRVLQRTAGTLVGALLAAGVAAAFRDPHGILAAIFVLTVVAVSLLPVNYTAYSVFLTAPFVLLAELGARDWHLAGVRVTHTLVGAAVALVGARLLWSSPERRRFPGEAAAALRECAEFLRAAVRSPGGGASEPALAALRRKAGLATMNAEASLQRLLAEAPRGDPRVEPAMALLAFARRLVASSIALAYLPHPASGEEWSRARRFGERAADEVRGVADALAGEAAPPPPAVPVGDALEGVEDAALRGRLDRLGGQVDVLRRAAARLADGAGRGTRPA